MKCIVIPRVTFSSQNNSPARIKSADPTHRSCLAKQSFISRIRKKATIGIQCNSTEEFSEPKIPNASFTARQKSKHRCSSSLLIEHHERYEFAPSKKRSIEKPKIFSITPQPATPEMTPKKLSGISKIQSTYDIIKGVKPNLLLYKVRSVTNIRKNKICFKSPGHYDSKKVLKITSTEIKNKNFLEKIKSANDQSMIIQKVDNLYRSKVLRNPNLIGINAKNHIL
ncbi:unnamed protein product [Blepharisma stoltei]|uniref:Uncharacterized protein n=1 Tax=Blepharisma stoltei TaxID=1481888 RepID=A0AAU9J288_9CILI|nr:unnamed protein product [Blepharisma stoltei]